MRNAGVQLEEQGLHFRNMSPNFSVDAGTPYAFRDRDVSTLHRRDVRRLYTPDEDTKVMRCPSWRSTLTIGTDVCL